MVMKIETPKKVIFITDDSVKKRTMGSRVVRTLQNEILVDARYLPENKKTNEQVNVDMRV